MQMTRHSTALLAAFVCISSWSLSVSAAEARQGVLVLAHGGNAQWNASVREAVAQAELPYATDVAFGMGMMPQEVAQMQAAVDHLQAQGVGELLVVPLLVSSHSEVYRQYEYLLGIRRDSPWPHHTPSPLVLKIPVRLGTPLDSHPYVEDIVLERARALSQDPAGEVVVLVAHGPNSVRDNEAWLATMREIAQAVQRQGRFARVEACTLRDDASWFTRRRAARALRHVVAEAGRAHRALVVPLLMARGGIEQKIPGHLRGLAYRYNGETLVPHPRIALWIRDAVASLSHAVARRRQHEFRWQEAVQVVPVSGT